MKSIKILVIDDEPSICEGCRLVLSEKSWVVDTCLNGTEGIGLLRGGEYDLALLDLKLTDMNGMDILRRIKKKKPGIHIIVMTGYASVENAVKAIN